MVAAQVDTSTDPPMPSRSALFTVGMTFFTLGITTQVILLDGGTAPLRAFIASAVIFSATSEFAYLAVVGAGGSKVAAVIAGWIVASRFGILATSISRVFTTGWPVRAAAAVNAFDLNVGMALLQRENRRAQRAFWWVTAAMMFGWFVGITIGTLLGDAMGDTRRFGIDALFPAALLAIVGGQVRQRDGLVAGAVGALICLLLIPVAPAGLPIILALGGVAAALLFVDRPAVAKADDGDGSGEP